MAQAGREVLRDEDWLEKKYEDEELSVREIALTTGVSWDEARDALDDAGVEVTGNSDAHDALVEEGRRAEELDDEETLRRLYEDMTQEEIGDKFDVTQSTVSYHLKKHGIETGPGTPEELDDEDTLKELYVERNYILEDIAGMFGVSTGTVQRRLEKHGIEADPPGGGSRAPKELRDRDWLADKLHGENWSEKRVADELGCNIGTVRGWRRRLLV